MCHVNLRLEYGFIFKRDKFWQDLKNIRNQKDKRIENKYSISEREPPKMRVKNV